MDAIIKVFNHTLMITGFVFVMMLAIEYINVLTSGSWRQRLATARGGQYLFAALMGIIPGCLGAFIVVAMYSHRMLSLGAVITAMIATSGDEAFVMLALIPKQALLLTGILFIIGVAAGFVTDAVTSRYKTSSLAHLRRGEISYDEECESFELHTFESCRCFPRGQILAQWKERSPFRTILTLALILFIIMVLFGQIGPPEWNWVRISILFVMGLAFLSSLRYRITFWKNTCGITWP